MSSADTAVGGSDQYSLLSDAEKLLTIDTAWPHHGQADQELNLVFFLEQERYKRPVYQRSQQVNSNLDKHKNSRFISPSYNAGIDLLYRKDNLPSDRISKKKHVRLTSILDCQSAQLEMPSSSHDNKSMAMPRSEGISFMVDVSQWEEEYQRKEDQYSSHPAKGKQKETESPIISTEPTASLGTLIYTVSMISLLLVGIGLLTGFFPLTLLGLTLSIVTIVGGLVIGIWQYARPPKANDR